MSRRSTWSRATYELVQEIIAALGEGQPARQRECAEQAAALFAADSPRFDRDRFLIGCGCNPERLRVTSEPEPQAFHDHERSSR